MTLLQDPAGPNWNAISAISSAVSGIAAAVATFWAYKSLKDGARAAKEERAEREWGRRETRYEGLIMAPSYELFRQFIDRVGPSLNASVADYVKSRAVTAVEPGRVKQLARSFQSDYRVLKSGILTRLEALEDAQLSRAVRKDLHELEDVVTQALEVVANGGRPIDFHAALDAANVSVMKRIRVYVEGERDKVLAPPPKRPR